MFSGGCATITIFQNVFFGAVDKWNLWSWYVWIIWIHDDMLCVFFYHHTYTYNIDLFLLNLSWWLEHPSWCSIGHLCLVAVRTHVSARQNLRPLGTVTPGHWYLMRWWNSQERSKHPRVKSITHKMNTPQKFESERQLRTMTKTITVFLVSESLQTHPHRERERER